MIDVNKELIPGPLDYVLASTLALKSGWTLLVTRPAGVTTCRSLPYLGPRPRKQPTPSMASWFVSLECKDAHTTSAPAQDSNPSRFVNRFLDSVTDHKVCHRPSNNRPFHPLVISLGGMMSGSTPEVVASWKQVLARGTYSLMLKRLSLSLLQAVWALQPASCLGHQPWWRQRRL